MQPFANLDKRVLGSKWIVHRFDRKPKKDRKPGVKLDKNPDMVSDEQGGVTDEKSQEG